MSLQSRSKRRWKPLAFALTAILFVCPHVWAQGAANNSAGVETYVDQAVPPPDDGYSEGPLRAGQMTLEDVLQAHPARKKLPPQPPALGTMRTTNTAPPVLMPSAQASTEGTML